MQASIFGACPKPGEIGKVVPGRASGEKMVGMAEMGAPISLDGVQSFWIVGVSGCVIFILHQTIQKMAKYTFWYQLTRVVPDKVHRAVKWLCLLYVVCCVCALKV